MNELSQLTERELVIEPMNPIANLMLQACNGKIRLGKNGPPRGLATAVPSLRASSVDPLRGAGVMNNVLPE